MEVRMKALQFATVVDKSYLLGGQVTNSQLFPFTTGDSTMLLAPENANGATCLTPNDGLLDPISCSGDASQLFTIS